MPEKTNRQHCKKGQKPYFDGSVMSFIEEDPNSSRGSNTTNQPQKINVKREVPTHCGIETQPPMRFKRTPHKELSANQKLRRSIDITELLSILGASESEKRDIEIAFESENQRKRHLDEISIGKPINEKLFDVYAGKIGAIVQKTQKAKKTEDLSLLESAKYEASKLYSEIPSDWPVVHSLIINTAKHLCRPVNSKT